MFAITLLLGYPLGKYMAKVYGNERTFLDLVFNPIEKLFFKFSGINPAKEQTWKQQLSALLTINLIWFLLGMFIFMNQSWLP
ncbi:MAG TPA: potassium-transporting ATPase subunit KdpA, partial [Chryseobacterium sp.]|nr:potassium-transporting ATPase subunit KdpA [Chryseobacterium sp.]